MCPVIIVTKKAEINSAFSIFVTGIAYPTLKAFLCG